MRLETNLSQDVVDFHSVGVVHLWPKLFDKRSKELLVLQENLSLLVSRDSVATCEAALPTAIASRFLTAAFLLYICRQFPLPP